MTDYSFDAEVKSYGFCMGSVKVVVALGVWCGKAKNELCFRTKCVRTQFVTTPNWFIGFER